METKAYQFGQEQIKKDESFTNLQIQSDVSQFSENLIKKTYFSTEYQQFQNQNISYVINNDQCSSKSIENNNFQHENIQSISLKEENFQSISQKKIRHVQNDEHNQNNQFFIALKQNTQSSTDHQQLENKKQNTLQNLWKINPHLYLQRIHSIQNYLTKIYYRTFLNRLITFYIYSLKQQQRKIRQTKEVQIKILKEQNWPFKQLFYKKNKNQNQKLMLQFVNMCAEKIQSIFKGYITHKRHKLAFFRVQKFKTKFEAVVKGWKVWNIYNCKKIFQFRKNIKQINSQVEKVIQDPSLERQKKMKKIQYLNDNEIIIKENFRRCFYKCYESGTWIFQVDACFSQNVHMRKEKFTLNPYKEQVITRKDDFQNERIQIQISDEIQSSKFKNKGFQKVVRNKQKKQFRKENLLSKNSQSTTNFSSQFEEKPIVTKGRYIFDEEMMKNSDNQFLNYNQQIKITNKQDKFQNQNGQQIQQKSNKIKQRNKMIKRQKYDPRKAIQEQKKKLQQERKIKIQRERQGVNIINEKKETKDGNQKNQKTPNKIGRKTPLKGKKQLVAKNQSPEEQRKDKTVEKVKKESKLIKKQDNSKSVKSIISHKKIPSKVDCWINKKQLQPKTTTNIQQSSYKSKYLMSLKQKNSSQYQNNQISQSEVEKVSAQIGLDSQLKIHIKNKIQVQQSNIDQQQYIQQNDQAYKSNFLKKLSQQKIQGTFSYTNKRYPYQNKFVENQKQKFIQKQTQLNENKSQKVILKKQISISQKVQELHSNIKRLSQNRSSLSNLKHPQKIENKLHKNYSQHRQININKKKEQVYRSVQSLDDVYSSQYTDRFNNLKSKLNMLESTRYIQRDEQIPILLEDSRFVQKMYKNHTFSSLYWPQVRTMQTNFLDYIKFNLTSV